MCKRMLSAMQFVGKSFERWTVVSVCQHRSRSNKIMVSVRCQCGTEKNLVLSDVKNGHTKSCGCLKIETTIKRSTTHGMGARGKRRSREYNTWAAMIQRCTDANSSGFYKYGARGIKVCDRWLNSFEDFLSDMGQKPTPKHTIDRIDNNGNYEPENCRWATPQEQLRNTRRSHRMTYRGKTMTIVEWAEFLGIERWRIDAGVRQKRSDEEILSEFCKDCA